MSVFSVLSGFPDRRLACSTRRLEQRNSGTDADCAIVEVITTPGMEWRVYCKCRYMSLQCKLYFICQSLSSQLYLNSTSFWLPVNGIWTLPHSGYQSGCIWTLPHSGYQSGCIWTLPHSGYQSGCIWSWHREARLCPRRISRELDQGTLHAI